MREQKERLLNAAAIGLGGIYLGAALGAAAGIFCVLWNGGKERDPRVTGVIFAVVVVVIMIS